MRCALPNRSASDRDRAVSRIALRHRNASFPVMTPLLHHKDYDAETVPDGHRFPMRKYSRVAEALRVRGRTFLPPDAATRDALCAVHDPAYVDAVLEARLDAKAARKIGFETTPAVAERARRSVGGTLLAAQLALRHGRAVNLAGGSHHAGPFGGAGFCVFNDVAVAASELLQRGDVARVAVIDLDVHHGDGTASIFASHPQVFTASVHCEQNWPRHKPAGDLDLGLDKGTGDAAYLSALAETMPGVFDRARPDLVFYNAGVDPHRDDRLGLLDLTDDGLRARDRMVAEACRARGVPICGVLGGGYQTDVDAVAGRHVFLVDAMDEVFQAARV